MSAGTAHPLCCTCADCLNPGGGMVLASAGRVIDEGRADADKEWLKARAEWKRKYLVAKARLQRRERRVA